MAFESHFSPSLSGSKQKAGKSRPCLAQPSLTIFGVCPRAGMIRSIRSVVLNFKLDVFTQGWHPKYSFFKISSSIRSCTLCSISFINPITLTEPGVMSKYCFINSGLAKDNLELPICADNSLVLNGLFPGIRSR